ncbi:MAG TPA: hypothetical protein VGK57_07925, partial [Candidatus Binatia bacterium]
MAAGEDRHHQHSAASDGDGADTKTFVFKKPRLLGDYNRQLRAQIGRNQAQRDVTKLGSVNRRGAQEKKRKENSHSGHLTWEGR